MNLHSLRNPARQRGFTLIELLVVMVIAGILLGMVSFNIMPGDQQRLQQDAQRIALLFQLARDEAILRNTAVAFEADQQTYRFLIKQEQSWITLKDDMLREREFETQNLQLRLESGLNSGPSLRIVFGREPVDKAFILSFISNNQKVSIRADGIGHFYVE